MRTGGGRAGDIASFARCRHRRNRRRRTGLRGGIEGTSARNNARTHALNLRIVLKISKDETGELKATVYSIDQNGRPIASSSVSFEGRKLLVVNKFPGPTRTKGTMSADGNSLNGTVTQNGSLLLVLERATASTEWAYPHRPPRILPMAADAHPTFEVATIKPSPPDRIAPRSTFRV